MLPNIVQINPDGPAANLGIQPGDSIVSLKIPADPARPESASKQMSVAEVGWPHAYSVIQDTPGLTNPMLFARDRQVCAYCGGRFMYRDLSRDHIVPASRGGRDTWMNSVTACRSYNTRKGNRAPEQANMPLLYVPYVPNRHEHFILRNRRILADQMEYLLAGVPRTSRLHLLPHAA